MRDRASAAACAAGTSAACAASRSAAASRWRSRWSPRRSTCPVDRGVLAQTWTDLGAIVPLVRDSSFGRAFSDLWLALALLGVAAAVALALDRPEARARSGEALLALFGAAGLRGRRVRVPGPRRASLDHEPGRRHARARLGAPRGGVDLDRRARGPARAVRGDAAGTRVAMLAVIVPRFSRAAIASVAALLFTGIVASIVHLPTLARSGRQLRPGADRQERPARVRARARRRQQAALAPAPRGGRASAATRRSATALRRSLQRLVLGEVALLAGAVVAAAILTSIAPPSSALAQARQADGRSGPVSSRGRSRATACASRSASGPTAPRSTTPSRCACSAPASPCATRASPPSSTCST